METIYYFKSFIMFKNTHIISWYVFKWEVNVCVKQSIWINDQYRKHSLNRGVIFLGDVIIAYIYKYFNLYIEILLVISHLEINFISKYSVIGEKVTVKPHFIVLIYEN